MSRLPLPRAALLAALLCSSLLLASLVSHAQSSPEPQVTERQEGDRTLREFRINGQLYAIEIRTRDGDRYHLLDRRGDGNFSRVSGDAIEVPDWVNTGR
ncbi:DUF2782 domain-containing protein [Halomonas salipaludis]|uniref:DUF2782 domain-containing protein n=1 Tax=Halomonas salipaludis TaxID=2032625 RepID=A0A2A2ER28_9GAMM|nr:DUF2782 domain-containing protein [Halomonas salipaludis]PAU74934.1 hypothetical protein CK498_20475 [Halomonas salipaludis]